MEKLLDRIDSPEQLRTLTVEQLTQLAGELREFIIQTVSKTGGHLAPSLGTIELTLALYSVFNLPVDKVVWDVGHQAYAHKILTGRRDRFATLRQKEGITGFPRRDESPYDAFGVGHASTSISADLGKNLIVVLNDNGMSIDCNVGAMSEYLSRIRVTPQYNRAKKDLEGLLKSIPRIGDTVLKTAGYIKDGVRSVLVPGGL